jgi:two-component system, OmpR family, phosphate regulon sensor histidine kinase PhoR
MLWRFVSFLLCQLIPAAVLWKFGAPEFKTLEIALALVLGGLLWLILDALRGMRLLRWLRSGDTSSIPLGNGLWGEVFDRVRKVVGARDKEIIASEGRLQDFLAAFQASPNGVVLLDANGRIEWFNQTAAVHFGFDAKRDLLQHFGNLVRDPEFAAYIAKADFRMDVVMPGRDHSLSKPVKLSVHLHPYGGGRNLLLSRDITSVEQAEAMRRDFVANVSHEIRTPLTVLSGFVETLQSLELDEGDRQRYLSLMAQQAQRMQTLVHDLLMLSRLEGSPLPSTHEWVPIESLMGMCQADALALARLAWGSDQGLHFENIIGWEIAGSSAELHSALSNLITNAIRYTPADKEVEVSWTELPNGTLVFAVKDTGPGIAPEHLPRLTERFYRIDRSRSRDTGGTGLGLAIVKHVAQRHGAELQIESTLGKGSTFALVFPTSRVRRALKQALVA